MLKRVRRWLAVAGLAGALALGIVQVQPDHAANAPTLVADPHVNGGGTGG